MERRAFVKIALDMRIFPQTWKLFKHLHYVVYIKLANTLHYGKKNMKNWKQTDDFVKYVIYVVVIKICRNVYASYRCYLFYSKSIKQFVSFKLLLISKSIAQWVLSTKIKHHDLRMGIFRQHNLSLFQI